MQYVSVAFVVPRGMKPGEPFAGPVAYLTRLTTKEELQSKFDEDHVNLTVEDLKVFHGAFAQLVGILSSNPSYKNEIVEVFTGIYQLNRVYPK